MDNEKDEDLEVDYLHPDGKPKQASGDKEGDTKPDLKSFEQALREADGHSMRKADAFLHPEDGESDYQSFK